MQYGFKNLPLGWPMTVASVGTLATLWAGKKFHAGFGIAWAALSFWHGWQYHKKMQDDACRLAGCGKKPLEDYRNSFTGVNTAVITPLTGSLLITYNPEKLRQKPKLARLEQQLAEMAAECIG